MTDSGLDGFFEKLERVRLDFASLVRELSDIPFASVAGGDAGWSEPLGTWWARERDGTEPEVAALYEKLVEHGRVLFLLAERLGTPRGGETSKDGADLMVLLETFQRSMSDCLAAASMSGSEMFSPMSHLVDRWQQHAGRIFALPGNPAQAFPDMLRARDAESLQRAMAGLVDPAVNAASRLHGEPLRELAEALTDYQDTFNRFARLAVEATGDAFSRMETALAAQDTGEPRGVREFYDLWLQCCEQTYDELARDAGFSRLLGELVNGAVRVHAARQRLADSTAESLGLPTRRHVRELSASLHETRRRLARLERGRDEPAGGNPLAREARPSQPLRPAAGPSPWFDDARAPAPRREAKATKKAPAAKKAARKKTARKKTANQAATGKKTAKKKITDARKSAAKKSPARRTAPGGKTADDSKR